jgi:hypothetical protein
MFHVFQILMPWAEDSRAVFRHVHQFIERVLADAPPLGSLDLVAALGLQR